MKKLNYLIIVVIIALASCEKADDIAIDSQPNIQEMIEFLESTGLTELEVEGEEFISEGDMVISFETVKELMANSNSSAVEQYKYKSPYYCNQNHVTHVAIFIKSGVPDGWVTATRDAIVAWNGISGSKINFYETSDQSASDLEVKSMYSDGNWVGRAELPGNGKPGSYVHVNTRYNYLGASKKKNTLAHELGHIIGFAHTNGKGPVATKHIEGTRTTAESASVMYKNTHKWTGFTADDVIAAQVTFPQE